MMQQALSALFLGGAILSGLTLMVLPTIDQNKALRTENQALQAEIETLEQRYIDQLLRNQQND
ncbi:MAG: hypothetical protein SAJ12_23580 [Jaaginema sp. PMC 1079.18]|nr:hypothetical protein [Jaaginema sp. PMC 1080.18]MEC4853974.1 hypothetical protein [Jaaginema sp. PMC 1079.18]MEC4868892.1 hypothetical protein [Jaaginema sp. PMC 1078.18]